MTAPVPAPAGATASGTAAAQVSFRLDGKVAVVTGGSRGLGQAICEAYAANGATVVVASRKQDACVAMARELTARTGQPSLGVACHVGHWDECDQLIKTVNDAFGRVDVLVNNAGMSPLYESLGQVSEDLFDKVVAVNLKGAFRLSVLAGEQMAAGAGGSIINMSSTGSVQPRSHEVPYAAAKAALNSMTLGLARSFGPSVRVNGIMPGPFLTDIAKSWDQEQFARRAAESIPLRRGGEPHEIVGAALYLASDASSFTTGTIIKVDGGVAYGAS